jgi:peptidyl-tRNA hydrolase ICT1
MLHSAVMSSRFYAERSRSLVLQSDDSRSQKANQDTCYSKLHMLLVELAKERIPSETPQAQKDKVKKLQRSDNEARLRNKRRLSGKKTSRSRGFGE